MSGPTTTVGSLKNPKENKYFMVEESHVIGKVLGRYGWEERK